MYQILIRVRAQLCQVADERRHPQEELPIAGMRRQEQYCLSGNQHDAQVIARCQEPDQATDTARFPRDIHLVVRLGSELPQLISRPPSIPNTDAANDHRNLTFSAIASGHSAVAPTPCCCDEYDVVATMTGH